MTIQKPQQLTPKIQVLHDECYASSLDVAVHFGKQHKDVLRAIDHLRSVKFDETSVLQSMDENRIDRRKFTPIFEQMQTFGSVNFVETVVLDTYGREQRAINMTRSGFTILAMGFQGSKALFWKIRYEQAFRELEAEVRRERARDGIIKRAERHLELFPEFKTTLGTTRRAMTCHAAALHLQLQRVIIPAPTATDLLRLIKNGKLEGFKNNRWFVFEDSLCHWLENRSAA